MMMSQRNEEYLNDAIHALAYETVKRSPLFDSLETNNAVDGKADELADLLKSVIQSWIDQECGSSVLLEHAALNEDREAA